MEKLFAQQHLVTRKRINVSDRRVKMNSETPIPIILPFSYTHTVTLTQFILKLDFNNPKKEKKSYQLIRLAHFLHSLIYKLGDRIEHFNIVTLFVSCTSSMFCYLVFVVSCTLAHIMVALF